MMQSDKSQILVNSKTAKFLLKVRKAKKRNPMLEEAIINKISSLEGVDPSRHIYVKKL